MQDFSLRVSKGEIFGLIGLNGSGKTTLIKLILNLSAPDKGNISIFGEDCNKIASRKNIAYLPEKFQPSSFLTGEEFLTISLAYRKTTYDPEKSGIMCKNLALDQNILKKKIKQYSKGMGQKLGLISTFLSNADFYILDEPASGLDHHTRVLLKKLFLETKKSGKTILFSSHILSDIEEICDRIAIINNGKLDFIGTSQELCTKFKEQTLENAFMSLLQDSAVENC